jgi:FMN phosphatase YigB (HAD superfamily)
MVPGEMVMSESKLVFGRQEIVGSGRMQQRMPSCFGAASRRLFTFDVFETLLVRSVSPHHEIFDRVGRKALERGFITCSAYAFARAREAADRRARTIHGDAMKLSDLYAEVETSLTLSSFVAEEVMNLELEEEARSLRAVESARALLADARVGGRGVVFVSDMYLPAAFIREQLEKHRFWHGGDRLYVSHEHGCDKCSGHLFRVVAAGEGVSPAQITHFGNHLVADLEGPRKAGATGRLVTAGNPNRYERALEAHRHETDGKSAIMSGASRLARTTVTAETAIEQAKIDVAAGVVAPVLTSFVLWLFRQAEERGLKRLYFLSRDAEIMLQIARQIAPKLNSEVELRYLYASRLAWNSAVSSPDENPHLWYSVVYQSGTGFKNAELLERVGLTSEEVTAITATDTKAWNSTKDREILRTTLAALHADGTLQGYAERNKEQVLDYLRQEGLFDGTPHAVVDVGWRGTQHDVLIELQKEQQVDPAYGFFFGLDLSDSKWGALRSAFYFDARRIKTEKGPELQKPTSGYHPPRVPEDKGQLAPQHLYPLFEMFCAGREGSLQKYQREGDRVLPVTDQLRPHEVQAWNLDLVYEVVAVFVANFELDHASLVNVDVRTALADVIDLLWSRPTTLEAEAWGSFPWELGLGSSRCNCDFAPPYDHRYVGKRFGLNATLATQWPAASLLRSHPVMSACKTLKDGTAYQRLLGKSKSAVKRLLAASKNNEPAVARTRPAR